MAIEGLTPSVSIRASAGSGKTYALTLRYLKLLTSGVAPTSILATTFTRKAAGEILGRVVGRLADAVVAEPKREELARELRLSALAQEEIERLFLSVADRLASVRIGTLDRTFADIVRREGFGLGLLPTWNILDDIESERLYEESVSQMLDQEGAKAVAVLCRHLSKGEVKRSIHAQILQQVRALHDLFVQAPASAWTALVRSAELDKGPLEQAIERIERFPLADAPALAKAREKDVDHARREEWIEFLAKGIPGKLNVGSTTYQRATIPDRLIDAYFPVIDHATEVLRGRLVDQNHATFQILESFDRVFRERQLQSGSLRFADVTHQLSAAVERVHDPFPEIRHVLLDEFQDTSVEQWQILEVLAQRCSVTEDHSFFCVGDPKQAIYGWRGGSSALLHHLGVQLPGLAERQLTRSHRFSPVISDLVNRVFGGLSDSIVFVDKDAASEAARRWQRGFTTHHAVHADRPGYARLMVALPTDEEEDRATATLRHAAGEVASLRRESPGATIGVLVRDNDAVARLLFELEAMGVSASEEGGNPLSRSPAVALVLSFLEWLDHPGSSASLFHVVESPWGTSLCLQEGASIADQDRVADRWRRLFSEQGITATLLSLTAELMTHVDSTERRALDQLIRLAQRYSPRDSGRLSDFVRHVEGTKVDSPSSSVVRVMTVHQSKGLEFDIVVLPQLDKLLVGQTPPVVFGRESASGPIRAICCYANESIRAVLPASIQKIFEESREAEYEEALCLLYVAMTRAIHAVHMIIAPAKENERTIPTTFAGVLRSALAPNMPALPGAVLFELGRRQAFAAKVVEEQAAGEGKEIG